MSLNPALGGQFLPARGSQGHRFFQKCGRVNLIQPDSILDDPTVGLLFSKI